MTREEELFQRHLIDLSETAWRRGIITFTDFLNLNEQNIYHAAVTKFPPLDVKEFGGYEYAERRMVAFIPDALSVAFSDFPISCLRISPLNKRFSDELTHRDYLGSLMNLGIDRSRLGDIVRKEDEAFLFCHSGIADYITKELTRIKHTVVQCVISEFEQNEGQPHFEAITGTVASERLDALLSLAFHASRSSLIALIEGGKTFVNGRLVTSNGYHPKENDIVSVRGYGRFRYCGIMNATKKGRYLVKIERYV